MNLIERVVHVNQRECQIEGVTVLGGEPLDQAEALAELFEGMRTVGLSTMLYTGHVYEALRDAGGGAVRRVLANLDVLVDGPFVAEEYDERIAWRGSRNQRLICLSTRYDKHELDRRFQEQRKAFSVRISPDGGLAVSGLQLRSGAALVGASVLRRRIRPE
jgi:anaerobic ribonucleoside-triphosphate reductase activating protein